MPVRRQSPATLASVASVSVRLRSKERGTRVKDHAKNSASKRAPLSFFGSCFISRVAKTENPVPRSFFAPKPNGNACYAGYSYARSFSKGQKSIDFTLFFYFLFYFILFFKQKMILLMTSQHYINSTHLCSCRQ